MIFVTVGTSWFDELVKLVDDLKARGFLEDEVVCQIGNGEYEPKHCRYFRFEPDIVHWFMKADLVIGHGGTGTVLELMTLGKRFIAVANRALADDHQTQFLKALGDRGCILWAGNVSELPEKLRELPLFRPKPFELPNLADDLIRFVKGER